MNSKRYKALPKETKKLPSASIDKLLTVIKKNCSTKFDESIDVNFQINVKQKKTEINLRSIVNLPSGTGKKIKVAVVCEEDKIKEANDAGADLSGADSLIDEISSGKINFEKLICTPSMMIKLGKLGKVLGPKGLMPNPKLGTVTKDVGQAVKLAKAGQLEIKNDKDGNIGFSIGKKSFTDENLIKNYNAVIDVINKEKPTAVKGELIKSAFITSSMGVSYKLKLDKAI
jgi:large subunit ribosomal protein L1